jgi:hypothetical protein
VILDGEAFVVSVVAGSISLTVGGQTVTIPAGRGTYLDLSKPDAPILVVSASDLKAVAKVAGNRAIQAADDGNYDPLAGLMSMAVVLNSAGTVSTGMQMSGNAGGQTSSGGSTLPNCSLISPVTARQPGTNCIN